MKTDELRKNKTVTEICAHSCNQCLYGKHKIVSDERRQEILNDLEQNENYFICHKAQIKGHDVMCRGYYENNKESSLLLRLARNLNKLRFVKISDLPDLFKTKKPKK